MATLHHLGHVHIKVSHLKKSIEFYTKILNFKITEIVGSYAFLTLGKHHHDLAIQEVENPVYPIANFIGLYHFAFEIKSIKDLKYFYKKLKEKNIPVSAINHGISKTVYFNDPDGNGIEIYLDTRHERKEWKGFSRVLDLL